jgi:hypothetical protein
MVVESWWQEKDSSLPLDMGASSFEGESLALSEELASTCLEQSK